MLAWFHNSWHWHRCGRSTFFGGKNAGFLLRRQGSMKPHKTPSLVQSQEETGSVLKYLKQSSPLKQLIGLTLSQRYHASPQAIKWYYTVHTGLKRFILMARTHLFFRTSYCGVPQGCVLRQLLFLLFFFHFCKTMILSWRSQWWRSLSSQMFRCEIQNLPVA